MFSPRCLPTVIIVAVVLIPMLLSLVFHSLAGLADYASQIGLLFLTIVCPFTAPALWRTIGLFLFTYGVWLLWGIWRFFFFDVLTKNDIPGMGYLLAPLLSCCIATILFFIRKRLPLSKFKQIKY